MRSWMWLFVVVALIGLIGADEVVEQTPKASANSIWELNHQRLNLNSPSNFSKSTLDYPEYLGADVDTVGWTYYDMQHNYTCGRNVAVDKAGGIHIVWMYADEATFADRHINYNYISPEGVLLAAPTMTIPVESSDRGGYTTIALAQLPPLFDTSATTIDVPVSAFHANYSSLGADPHTDIVWDGVYRIVGESAHGGFGGTESGSTLPGSGSLPPISYTNSTQYEDYVPEFDSCSTVLDLSAIWPVIETYGENVYLASTNSLVGTTHVCGVELGDWIIFHAGTPVYDVSNYISNYSFSDPLLLDQQSSITVDLAVDHTNGTLAAIYQHEGHPNTCDDTLVGSNYPEEFAYRTSTDNGVTWSERHNIIGYPGGMPTFDDLDTFMTPSVGWDTISAAETVWVAEIDTYYVSYNPNTILSAIYVDGVLHIAMEAWMFSYSSSNPFDEDPCHAYYLLGTAIIYWNSENEEVIPICRFAYGRPSYITYSDGNYVNAFEHSLDPSIAADDEGNLFITWDQCWADVYDFYRDSTYVNWVYANAGTLDAAQLAEYDTIADSVFLDQSAGTKANEDIYGVASKDHGQSWGEPYNISQTYSWGAEAGECLSELNTSLAEKVDDYLHIFTVLDLDAGENLRDCGEATNNPILYIAMPKDSLLVRAPDAIKEARANKPVKLAISAYPNPFNSSANIVWSSHIAGNGTVEILDLTGRKVTTLFSGHITAGPHETVWNGSNATGNLVPSGTYMCKIIMGDNVSTSKITLLK
ncbi:T9SS type A sorting domain-containing protein [bacterium]|nr:T9SS type A sorting domain-containing protein [bacterium]